MLINPEKLIMEKSLRLGFSATNNEAKYEALLAEYEANNEAKYEANNGPIT